MVLESCFTNEPESGLEAIIGLKCMSERSTALKPSCGPFERFLLSALHASRKLVGVEKRSTHP